MRHICVSFALFDLPALVWQHGAGASACRRKLLTPTHRRAASHPRERHIRQAEPRTGKVFIELKRSPVHIRYCAVAVLGKWLSVPQGLTSREVIHRVRAGASPLCPSNFDVD
jgi:hypothetical protein